MRPSSISSRTTCPKRRWRSWSSTAPEQVVGVFGDVEVRVPGDPEAARTRRRPCRGTAGRCGPPSPARAGPDARRAAYRRGSPGGTLTRAKRCSRVSRVPDDQAEVEREARDVRERQTRARPRAGSGSGRSDGRRAARPGAQPVVEVRDVGDPDALGGERGSHVLGPDAGPARTISSRMRALTAAMTSSRGHRVRRRGPTPGGRGLLHGRHAHHEELVEDVGADRQEPAALQQRCGGVLGLGQHAREEVQPAQLAVRVERRIVQVDRPAGDCRRLCASRRSLPYRPAVGKALARRARLITPRRARGARSGPHAGTRRPRRRPAPAIASDQAERDAGQGRDRDDHHQRLGDRDDDQASRTIPGRRRPMIQPQTPRTSNATSDRHEPGRVAEDDVEHLDQREHGGDRPATAAQDVGRAAAHARAVARHGVR